MFQQHMKEKIISTKKNPDILLIQSPAWGINMPPMSLGYISAYLRKNNISTMIEDINIKEYQRASQKGKEYWINEKAHYWMEKDKFDIISNELKFDFKKIASYILKYNPISIGFSVTASNRFFCLELIREIRNMNPKIPLILGGKGVWTEEERYEFCTYTDFFVIGSGEETILELVNGIKKGYEKKRLSEISGVFLKDFQFKFKPRPPINLKNLPFPTYEELDISLYTEKIIGMIFSQGCIADCNFCEDKPFQGYYRTRDPKQVFEELKFHVEKNKISHFWFHDLTINGNYKELEKLCDLIIKNKLNIRWIALAIARKDMPKQLLKKMAEAGCYTLNFGIESGSDSVLKKMNKYHMFSVKDAERVLKDTREAGINVQPNFIVGYPGETKKEFKETLDFIKRNKDSICGITNINTCIIPKKSPIGSNPEKFELNKKNTHPVTWSQKNLDYKERLKRAESAYKLSEELGYGVYFSNLSQKEKKYDISLVVCPVWGVDTPPVGVNYLKAYLDNEDYSVKIIDINIDIYNKYPSLRKYWNAELKTNWTDPLLFSKFKNNFKDEIERIAKELVNISKVIGFSAYQENILFIFEISKKIKEIDKNSIIIVGGPSLSSESEKKKFNTDLIDYTIVGDGEESLKELLDSIKKNKSKKEISKIPGVWIPNLEKNYTKRKPFDLRKSAKINEIDEKNYKSSDIVSIYFSKGCIGKCTFCNDVNIMGKYRIKPAELLFEEIKNYTNKRIRKFSFNDLLINGNIPELKKWCKLIIENELDIEWIANAIPMKNLDNDILSLIKRSGCHTLMFGIETGSEKILKDMKKYTDINTIEKLLKNCSNLGIKVWANFIIGYPTENEDDFKKTLEFISRNRKYIDKIGVANTYSILYDSELMKKRDEYNILLPYDKSVTEVLWFTKDLKNTDKIRKKRLKLFLEKSKKLDLEVHQHNLSAFQNYNQDFVKEFKNMKKIKPNIDEKRNLINKPNIKKDFFSQNRKKHEDSPIKLFFLCLNEHSLTYTLNHTIKYVKKLLKNKRKSDILLVNCPPWDLDSPPYSLAYLESLLENKRFETDVFDFNIELYSQNKKDEYLWTRMNKNIWKQKDTFESIKKKFQKDIDDAIKKISDHPAKIIGFSISDPKQAITFYIIKKVKEVCPEKIIVAGGPYYMDALPDKEKEIIDFFIIGNSENSLVELIKKIKKGGTVKNIPGIMYYDKKKKKLLYIKEKKEKTNMRNYSFPKYKNFKLDLYKTKNICCEWSRGCVGKCGFCQNPVNNPIYSFRNYKNIVDEIEYNLKKNKINSIIVIDPAINGNIKNLERVCDEIIMRKLNVSWSGLAIPRKEMTFEILKKMKHAGCVRLEYGIESGSNKVLKIMKKLHTSEDSEKVLKLTKSLGIETVVYLIIGYPGESEEDFKKTLNFLESNKENIDLIRSINVPYLQDGTDLMCNYNKYDIVFEKTKENFAYQWKTSNNKNNIKIREKRARKCIDFVNKLGIPFELHILNENKKLRLKKNDI